MTDNNHLITPPTDLVIDWRLDPGYIERTEKVTMVTMTTGRLQYIATQAARWGADMELEACREEIVDGAGRLYIDDPKLRVRLADDIWTARRPKPPSLKEEVKQIIDCLVEGDCLNDEDEITLRRALEQLND